VAFVLFLLYCRQRQVAMATKRADAANVRDMGGARKRLRAADVVLTTPSMRAASGSGSDVPPVLCSIAAYGMSGTHASRYFPEAGRIWQVQLEHVARPSLFFAFLKNWLDYQNSLRRAAGREEARSLEELERNGGARVVLTGADDEHGFTNLCTRMRHGATSPAASLSPRTIR
jgi:hypothetical protein